MANTVDGTERLAGRGNLAALSPLRRREKIAAYVLAHDVVAAKELAARFDVSVMTVHRDLDELERQGVLRKVHGGATPQPSSLFESNVRFRLGTARVEKEAIARHAVKLVESGQAVMLDDATTTLALARLLPAIAPVTVLTNYLATINDLREQPGIRLIALGGEYFPSHDSFTGVICEAAIGALRADIFFMSTSAVSGGLAFHQEQEIVKVKRAMLNAATRRVLLIDHTKLGKVALHRLAPLSDFDLVVVDAGVDPERLQELRDRRVPVEVAPL